MGRPPKTAPGIGERLAQLRGEMDRDSFASAIGVHANTIANYERGDRKVDPDFLAKLRETRGVDINWLLTGVDEKPLQSQKQSVSIAADMISVPRYSVQASAGNGLAVLAEDIADYMSVSRDWLQRMLPSWAPRNAVVGILEGAGDSMEPTIRDGDLLMIIRGVERRQVLLGGIFVFTHDGDLKLKRLQIVGGDLKIISDNRNYETETVPGDEVEGRVEFHGQVFFVGGRPRSFG